MDSSKLKKPTQPIDVQYSALLSKTDMEITTIEIKCIFPLVKKEPDVHFKTSGDHVNIEFCKHQGDMDLYTSITATSLLSHLF